MRLVVMNSIRNAYEEALLLRAKRGRTEYRD
jgi:hypothetical protein